MDWLFESKGIKRTLASIFAFLVPVTQAVPVLSPYTEIAIWLAAFFGGTGVAHPLLARIK